MEIFSFLFIVSYMSNFRKSLHGTKVSVKNHIFYLLFVFILFKVYCHISAFYKFLYPRLSSNIIYRPNFNSICIQFGKTEPFGKSPRFCQIVYFHPQSPCYQRYQKPQKERLTSHPGEPLHVQSPLISSHFFTLSLNRSKILWHQI